MERWTGNSRLYQWFQRGLLRSCGDVKGFDSPLRFLNKKNVLRLSDLNHWLTSGR